MAQKPLMLVAFGGNALIQSGQRGTAEEQFENLKLTMRQVAQLSKKYKIVITHGNGPQVGNLLLQQESCDEVPKMPLEIIGAMTQGQIGYMIESSLDTSIWRSRRWVKKTWSTCSTPWKPPGRNPSPSISRWSSCCTARRP